MIVQLKAYWAYDFVCDRAMSQMLSVLNDAGPWAREQRESAWYGDYLSASPGDGVRVRIHQYPQSGESSTFVGRRDKGFSALLQIASDSSATVEQVDRTFLELLTAIGSADVIEIEPYD
jgi:hypothetical protein